MKSTLVWTLLSLLVFCSCTSSPKMAVDHNLVFDQPIIMEMESELALLNDEIIFLKDQFEFLLANRDSLLAYVDRNKYSFDGPFSTNTPKDSDQLSSVVILNTTRDYDKSLETAWLTNSMDTLFSQSYEKYGMLAQIYFNTADQVSRVYPAYDAAALLDPGLDLTTFNFFYKGDLEHNP
ncbi:MAG: hypothetical protein ABJC55_16435, partial [Algoriphagus sp.]